jgi:hypothetical protein
MDQIGRSLIAVASFICISCVRAPPGQLHGRCLSNDACQIGQCIVSSAEATEGTCEVQCDPQGDASQCPKGTECPSRMRDDPRAGMCR